MAMIAGFNAGAAPVDISNDPNHPDHNLPIDVVVSADGTSFFYHAIGIDFVQDVQTGVAHQALARGPGFSKAISPDLKWGYSASFDIQDGYVFNLTNYTFEHSEFGPWAGLDPMFFSDSEQVLIRATPGQNPHTTVGYYIYNIATHAISGPVLSNLRPLGDWEYTISAISHDGQKVAIWSADTAASGAGFNSNGVSKDLYVENISDDTITKITSAADIYAPGPTLVTFSPDDSKIAFVSSPTGSPSTYQVYVADLTTHTTKMVSQTAAGGPANNGGAGSQASIPQFSPDGRYLAFTSGATNLVPGTPPDGGHVFVEDLVTGTITQVSEAPGSLQTPNPSTGLGFVNGGKQIIFAGGNKAATDNGYTSIYIAPTNGGNDSLLGTTGNDTFDGGTGNDTITGNGGTDTVILHYTQSQASFVHNADGSWAVTSPGGSDHLTGIVAVQFNDATTLLGPYIALNAPTGSASSTHPTITGYTNISFAGTKVFLFEGTHKVAIATVAADGSFSAAVTLANGLHSLTATHTDAAHNTITSTAVSLLVLAPTTAGALAFKTDLTLWDADLAGVIGLTAINFSGHGASSIALDANAVADFGTHPIKVTAACGVGSLTVDGHALIAGFSAKGGNGADSFIGGTGNDSFTGGAGADLFDLSQGGRDLIADFVHGTDHIRFAGHSMADLHVSYSHGNAVIAIDATHQATLSHVAAHGLTASDFIFN
jgi:Ca2+-binding RTX toxin-like protein